jgi:hypothetical protein
MRSFADFVSSCFAAAFVLAALLGIAASSNALADEPLTSVECSPASHSCEYCEEYDDSGCIQWGCDNTNCFYGGGENCFCFDQPPNYPCGCYP